MGAMIELKDLTRRFGQILAVDRVNLTVSRGEVLGFLGPNGAGKSTTMKMVTGYLTPTSGSARVCDHDVVADPIAAKQRIGYLPEGAPAYPDMTPASFLRFVADVRGLKGPKRGEAIERALSLLSLNDVVHQPIETLSKGFKRRVGLAQAILHDPEVLVMDEPTDGLDPNQKHEVRRLIREMAQRGSGEGGKAIVLSTHILEEVEAVCTRAVIVARGRVVFDGSAAQLQQRSRYHNAVSLTLRLKGGADARDAAVRELAAMQPVSGVENAGGENGMLTCTVLPKGGASIAHDIGQLARQRGWEVDGMAVIAGRLDDVFRELTLGRTGAGK